MVDCLQQISGANDKLRASVLVAQVLATAGQKRRDTLKELAGVVRGQNLQAIPDSEFLFAAVADATSMDDVELPEEIAATSPLPDLRLSAMLGIRRLGAKKSMPFLIEQLNSADRDVQYQALITLAETTGKGGDYGPGLGLIERDPTKYKHLWLDWWKSEGPGSLR